ncbi:hypothetical protein ACH5RR_000190 [Cinchona calisaya]|uniref:Protein kinase domain-containing protein n=1 Tax=Cinchona calisaya TaxID=153742 RepID=A0ABD3B0W1_9GENT
MESHKSKLQKHTQRNDLESPYRLLHCSCKGDKRGVVQELDKGVKPNLADYDKRTALHLASCEGCTEVVVLLLERGADVNSTDRWGRTPLSDARSSGHEGICKILEAHGGTDPNYSLLFFEQVGLDSQMPAYEIDHTEVDMSEASLIGEGAYGEVYLVKWRGTEVAAKTVRSSIASNQMVKKTFLKELALWQKLRHPNIVQFLGVVKKSDRLTFLTEYLKNGSLYDILRKKGRLDPLTAVAYALDIARGMNYLHQHKPHPIIHRDLTPRNILQDEAGRLKVTDFGLSRIAQDKNALGYKMTGETGSYRYMAPEVYRREIYGISVDVFSFALVVHEMFQGGPSSREEAPEKVADKRAYEDSRPPLSSYVYPESIRKLLRDCWHKNPDCRPTFEEIILQLEIIQEDMQRTKTLGSCYKSKRVSKSPINRAKGGVFVSVRCEGSQEEEDDGFYTRRCVKGFILKLASLMLRYFMSVNSRVLNQLGDTVLEPGGYYSKLLQEYDAIVFSSTLLSENLSFPASKEPGANQPLQIVLAKDPSVQIPALASEATSKVIIFTEKDTSFLSKKQLKKEWKQLFLKG